MRIYVAGPYSADTAEERLANTVAAMQVGRTLLALGHSPYIPHLLHWFDDWAQSVGDPVEYDEYLDWGVGLLMGCEVLYFIGPSNGADYERAVAEAHDIPVITTMQEAQDLAWREDAT